MTTAQHDIAAVRAADALSPRVRDLLALHTDPQLGSPYWREFERRHGLRLADARTWSDLFALPPMDAAALRERVLEDFVPVPLHARRASWLVVQTGGATGLPTTTCYLPEDFEAAFIDPFLAVAERVGFPRGGGWLFVGPTGPHVIGRAADVLARRMGAPGIFAIDFDPRWFRRMADGSMGRRRYLAHVVEQAMAVISQQEVTVLFATPPTLAALADAMSEQQRQAIRGVHYGGTALTPQTLARFQGELFPRAVHLSGYGNTLFGCALELCVAPGRTPAYFPQGDRLRFALTPPSQGGQGGRVRFCRVDPGFMVLNMVERDVADLADPPADWADAGFVSPGLLNPRPAPQREPRGGEGIY
ncbi:MAG: hypothetical protein BIFFINMI_02120 [Phycisphaerae bacterium]|nr:hypothetical protein [Phycisphaerae bacterium]